MKKIPLANNKGEALIDDADFLAVSQYKWYSGKAGKNTYVVRYKDYSTESLHRFLMKPDRGMVVDHINRNPLDNRRCNLRVCTHQQNLWNQGKRSKFKNPYKGVYKNGSKWQVLIETDKKTKYFGTFVTPEDAFAKHNEVISQIRSV